MQTTNVSIHINKASMNLSNNGKEEETLHLPWIFKLRQWHLVCIGLIDNHSWCACMEYDCICMHECMFSIHVCNSHSFTLMTHDSIDQFHSCFAPGFRVNLRTVLSFMNHEVWGLRPAGPLSSSMFCYPRFIWTSWYYIWSLTLYQLKPIKVTL